MCLPRLNDGFTYDDLDFRSSISSAVDPSFTGKLCRSQHLHINEHLHSSITQTIAVFDVFIQQDNVVGQQEAISIVVHGMALLDYLEARRNGKNENPNVTDGEAAISVSELELPVPWIEWGRHVRRFYGSTFYSLCGQRMINALGTGLHIFDFSSVSVREFLSLYPAQSEGAHGHQREASAEVFKGPHNGPHEHYYSPLLADDVLYTLPCTITKTAELSIDKTLRFCAFADHERIVIECGPPVRSDHFQRTKRSNDGLIYLR